MLCSHSLFHLSTSRSNQIMSRIVSLCQTDEADTMFTRSTELLSGKAVCQSTTYADTMSAWDRYNCHPCISISPCGRYLARSIADTCIINPITLRQIQSLGVGALREVAFSPDGKYLLGIKATPNFDIGITTIMLFDIPAFNIVSLAHDNDYMKLSRPDFSPNSKNIIIGRFDTGRVFVLSVPELTKLRHIDTFQKCLIRCDCISGQYFAPISLDVIGMSVWDIKTGAFIKKVGTGLITCHYVTRSTNGDKFLCVAEYGVVFLIDSATLEIQWRVEYESSVYSCTFISNDQVIMAFECEPLKLVNCINGEIIKTIGDELDYTMEIAFCRAAGQCAPSVILNHYSALQ